MSNAQISGVVMRAKMLADGFACILKEGIIPEKYADNIDFNSFQSLVDKTSGTFDDFQSLQSSRKVKIREKKKILLNERKEKSKDFTARRELARRTRNEKVQQARQEYSQEIARIKEEEKIYKAEFAEHRQSLKSSEGQLAAQREELTELSIRLKMMISEINGIVQASFPLRKDLQKAVRKGLIEEIVRIGGS